MDTASQWPQDMVVKTMENMASHGKPPLAPASGSVEERKSRPHKEEALNCPRCNSTNTKFCYYNNYSLSQPRYFCKTCRRYWTHGGSLRNIPVGGGSRKNKRSSSSSSSSSPTSSRNIKLPDLQVLPPHHHHHHHHQNPKNQDLDLGFTIHHHNYDDFKSLTEMIQASDFSLDGGARPEVRLLQNPNSATGYPYVPPLMTTVTGAEISTSPAFPHLPEFKLSNSLTFSLDHGLGGSNYEGLPASESKVLFPFEELKQDDGSSKGNNNNNNNNNNNDNNGSEESGGHQENGGANRGYWNGVLGGGSW